MPPLYRVFFAVDFVLVVGFAIAMFFAITMFSVPRRLVVVTAVAQFENQE